jgi:gliding motility associated protien GldN
MQLNDFNPERITKFRIKEDIFFDKQRSKIETRIIGIAPLMGVQTSDVTVGEAPVFWLYYPQCRTVFVKKDVSNPDRNLFDISMDDIFLQRKFVSKIIRESNTTGQRIVDYAQDASEQEKEAKRIEAGIEDYKKKVWGYTSEK